MDMPLPSLSLAATFLLSIYFLFRAWTSPNPVPQKKWKTDTVMEYFSLSRRNYMLIFVYSGFIYHTLLILLSPSAKATICPHPEHLDPKFFTWNAYTVFFLGLILVSVPVRILAYQQLGANFTYELAKPKDLIKTGLYAHVRHPSYGPVYVCSVAAMALFMRWGGVAGCFAPTKLVQSSVLDVRTDVWYLWIMGLGLMWFLGKRIVEEEEMLASVFGQEWKEYARRTARVIPGIL